MDAKEREKESEGDGERALVTKTGCKEKYERKEDEMFSPTGGGLAPREASPWSLLLTDRETPFIPTPMTWRKRQCTLRQGLYNGGCCAGSLSVLPKSRSAIV